MRMSEEWVKKFESKKLEILSALGGIVCGVDGWGFKVETPSNVNIDSLLAVCSLVGCQPSQLKTSLDVSVSGGCPTCGIDYGAELILWVDES